MSRLVRVCVTLTLFLVALVAVVVYLPPQYRDVIEELHAPAPIERRTAKSNAACGAGAAARRTASTMIVFELRWSLDRPETARALVQERQRLRADVRLMRSDLRNLTIEVARLSRADAYLLRRSMHQRELLDHLKDEKRAAGTKDQAAKKAAKQRRRAAKKQKKMKLARAEAASTDASRKPPAPPPLNWTRLSALRCHDTHLGEARIADVNDALDALALARECIARCEALAKVWRWRERAIALACRRRECLNGA